MSEKSTSEKRAILEAIFKEIVQRFPGDLLDMIPDELWTLSHKASIALMVQQLAYAANEEFENPHDEDDKLVCEWGFSDELDALRACGHA